MQGVKFISGNINKRVNEKIDSYSNLLEVVKQLFNNTNENITIWYLNNGEKLIITSEEDYQLFMSKHTEGIARLEVSFDKKQGQFDYLLENVGMSESFAIYEKVNKEKSFEEKSVQNKETLENKHTETFVET